MIHKFITWRIWKLGLSKFSIKNFVFRPLSVSNFVFLDAVASLISVIPKNVLGPCHPLGQICPLSTHFWTSFSFWSNSYFQKLWLSLFHLNCFAKQFPEMTSCNTWNFLNNGYDPIHTLRLNHSQCINAVHLHAHLLVMLNLCLY